LYPCRRIWGGDLIQNDRKVKLAGPDKVRIERPAPTLDARVAVARLRPQTPRGQVAAGNGECAA
jgi:hypothetical protein